MAIMFIVGLNRGIYFASMSDCLLMYELAFSLLSVLGAKMIYNLLCAFIIVPHQYAIHFYSRFAHFINKSHIAPHFHVETNHLHHISPHHYKLLAFAINHYIHFPTLNEANLISTSENPSNQSLIALLDSFSSNWYFWLGNYGLA